MKATAAKTFSVDVAIQCAEQAMQTLGGYGVAEEYDTVRMLQDAWMGYSCDGTRDMLRLSMMAFLEMAQRGYLEVRFNILEGAGTVNNGWLTFFDGISVFW